MSDFDCIGFGRYASLLGGVDGGRGEHHFELRYRDFVFAEGSAVKFFGENRVEFDLGLLIIVESGIDIGNKAD